MAVVAETFLPGIRYRGLIINRQGNPHPEESLFKLRDEAVEQVIAVVIERGDLPVLQEQILLKLVRDLEELKEGFAIRSDPSRS